ncbi:MAG: hypothetical protein WEB06_01535 [Actinomycetota bacterium]
MARNAALVTTWSQPARGREAKAIESFMDFLTFWGKKAADGKVSEPEPFFSYDGGHGFAIVKGPSDVLQAEIDSEEHERLISKAQLTVSDLRQELYVTGDAEIQRGMQIFSESLNELGY